MRLLAAATILALFAGVEAPAGPPSHACGWTPPVTDHEVVVRNARELVRAVGSARRGTTILLDDGEYRLDQTLDVSTPGTVIRSRMGDRANVTIRGNGMTGQGIGVALSISAADVTIADLTVGYVRQHAIQVRGERQASRFSVHNVRLVDAGQQLLKGSVAVNSGFADDGLVACSRFEYTDTAPSDYTDGVDLLAAKGWVIRDNEFHRIRGPQREGYRAGPAILLWANSQDTVVERNLIVDSFRGIALGLVPGTNQFGREGDGRQDHLGGIVRNNVVCNQHAWANEAIEANAASGVLIEHNTVLTSGAGTNWSIGLRYASTSGTVRNNLTSKPFLRRDGGDAGTSGNVSVATPDWFVDAASCDLHLSAAAAAAIDAAVQDADVPLDFDGLQRVGPPDVGAFEFRGPPRPAARRR